MIRIASEKELIEAFRPMDREKLELPEGLGFPLLIVDYLAWVDPSGARVSMVFGEPGHTKPLGISFRRDQTAGGASRMCDWCHAHGSSDEIGLLTASSSDRKRVGVNLCLDLTCKQKIEESLTQNPRIEMRKVIDRVSRFARQAIF